MEIWLCSYWHEIQGWTTVQESYSRALEQRSLPLPTVAKFRRLAAGAVRRQSGGGGAVSCLFLPPNEIRKESAREGG